jgi:hypothetical protein
MQPASGLFRAPRGALKIPPQVGFLRGREYLSVKLDDPSFPAPIFASLVTVEGGDGYALIWSRRSTD